MTINLDDEIGKIINTIPDNKSDNSALENNFSSPEISEELLFTEEGREYVLDDFEKNQTNGYFCAYSRNFMENSLPCQTCLAARNKFEKSSCRNGRKLYLSMQIDPDIILVAQDLQENCSEEDAERLCREAAKNTDQDYSEEELAAVKNVLMKMIHFGEHPYKNRIEQMLDVLEDAKETGDMSQFLKFCDDNGIKYVRGDSPDSDVQE